MQKYIYPVLFAIALSLGIAGLSAQAYTTSSSGRSFSAPSRSYSSFSSPSRSYSVPSRSYSAPRVTTPSIKTYSSPSRSYTPSTSYKSEPTPTKTSTAKSPVRVDSSSYVAPQTVHVYHDTSWNPFAGNFWMWMWLFNRNDAPRTTVINQVATTTVATTTATSTSR